MQHAMLLLAAALHLHLHQGLGLVEVVSELGTESREFRLTCKQLSSNVAVLDAHFTSNITNDTRTILRALNHRCSGRNHCSFILHADYPVSKPWGPGHIFIKYACMPEKRVTRFCNFELTIPTGGGPTAQGFILSPGYPNFYIGRSSCGWKIRAPSPQRVEITLLDVSLSSAGSGSCEDVLRVNQEGDFLLETCEELNEPRVLVTNGSEVEIFVKGREGSLIPKRGVLIYYRAIDCPTLGAPIDGYLVHRNATAAEYRCCVGFVFPDTQLRVRVLHCLHNRWDQHLPGYCINIQNLTQIEGLTDGKSSMTDSHLIDVVIPSILIASLLIGNAVVVYFIYQYRKRKILDIQEEELNTMVAESRNVP